jgi:hypothetical protein
MATMTKRGNRYRAQVRKLGQPPVSETSGCRVRSRALPGMFVGRTEERSMVARAGGFPSQGMYCPPFTSMICPVM